MQKATINKKTALKRVFCHHKYFDARNFKDVPKPYEEGIKIYKVCGKCGKIKKHCFIKRNTFNQFHIGDYPFFLDSLNKITIVQGDKHE